jgi:hypothetical protein
MIPAPFDLLPGLYTLHHAVAHRSTALAMPYVPHNICPNSSIASCRKMSWEYVHREGAATNGVVTSG